MNPHTDSLMSVYEGWDGYQHSLVQALTPLTAEYLSWRPAAQLRTAGEIFRHIALGRVNWFLRMDAPGSQELARQINDWYEDSHGNRYIEEDAIAITEQTSELIKWLQDSWHMVDQTLKTWTVEDLKKPTGIPIMEMSMPSHASGLSGVSWLMTSIMAVNWS